MTDAAKTSETSGSTGPKAFSDAELTDALESARDIAHPAAKLMPLMSLDRFREFVESARDGIQLPTIWCGEQLLDGVHREAAAMLLEIEPPRENRESVDAYTLVSILNIQRRDLDTVARAQIAIELLPKLREEARARQGRAGVADAGRAVEKAAAMVGVSSSSVKRLQAVTKDAADEIRQAVESREISLSKAEALMKADRADKQAQVSDTFEDTARDDGAVGDDGDGVSAVETQTEEPVEEKFTPPAQYPPPEVQLVVHEDKSEISLQEFVEQFVLGGHLPIPKGELLRLSANDRGYLKGRMLFIQAALMDLAEDGIHTPVAYDGINAPKMPKEAPDGN